MMYGVVLWSASNDDKAVIWCEDHGELAYYRQTPQGEKVALDAGDWVQFDVTMERHMRYAHNPRLVAEGVFEDLVQSLAGRAPALGTEQGRLSPAPASDVINFSLARDRLHNRKATKATTSWA